MIVSEAQLIENENILTLLSTNPATFVCNHSQESLVHDCHIYLDTHSPHAVVSFQKLDDLDFY